MTNIDLQVINWLKSGYTAEQIVKRVQYGAPLFEDALAQEKLYIGEALIVGLENAN